MNNILPRKQGDLYLITKSTNKYPQKHKNISNEIQLLNEYENSTVNFDDVAIKTIKQKYSILHRRPTQYS